MSLSCTVFEIWRDSGRKLPIVTHPTVIWRPVGGDSVVILQGFLAPKT